ncbi:DHA2 family efflux MFS transporter permease subunit [Nocardioides rubriscoriae]|uniref:DHA2 family efflux MFS transporter permease subunit n=1 Tax=Nocardioides rubriscoriae TaxID=642762 RepID=UPI0011E0170C|nr:DHA2 family efflux MFS transporter permease subunit [Nocardioides rubriscoriae]
MTTDLARQDKDPWPALFALCLGFFMILVDSTIVSVATPALIEDLGSDVNAVVWVTSAYLLAYAVPVLITGRLGDRYGPKNLYLAGLTVFTLASLACGLTSTIEGLIIARVVQGLGASMITPQTMAIITRIFPAERRGKAMALWGATAGVATLVGPILGGVLVDVAGWEWIFFINVPIGVVGFVLAWRLVPTLETRSHRFDWLGVALSGVGMFLLVFGIQEGEQLDWSTLVWTMIAGGLVVLGGFVLWQARNKAEPLVPLHLFRDRNFSLANVAITVMGFSITSVAIPLMLWAQLVRGYSPTQAALLLAPMAIMTIGLAKVVGGLTDRVHPRYLVSFGFVSLFVSLIWLVQGITPDSAIWTVIAPMALFGVGNAFVWAPNSATATRNLPGQLAGAGSGVYNATRQLGAVVGAAGIAVLIDARLVAQGLGTGGSGEGRLQRLPEVVQAPYAEAMGQSLYLPAFAFLIGLVAVLFFERPQHAGFAPTAARPPATAGVPAD